MDWGFKRFFCLFALQALLFIQIGDSRDSFVSSHYKRYFSSSVSHHLENAAALTKKYALFELDTPRMDKDANLAYYSLFDDLVDAVYSAMAKLKFTNVRIVVTETGWPSNGDSNENCANVPDAHTYHSNRFVHVSPYQTWCLARADATPQALQAGLDWACCKGGVNCSAILAGGPCFEPNIARSHASWVFNAYYQMAGNAPGSCNFNGAARIVNYNPSHHYCNFQGR